VAPRRQDIRWEGEARTARQASIAFGGDTRRFEFGANWRRFLEGLDEAGIARAEDSLREMLATDTLDGRSFLDVGSGSGLFSLAAMRLGASRVHSFDYDPESVACTEELRRRFFGGSAGWTVELGDVTDAEYVRSLGRFDLVYAWGVLHHTGAMWRGMDNACRAVAEGGLLLVAIYNDQGWRSRAWRAVKRAYVRAPGPLRAVILALAGTPLVLRSLLLHAKRRDLAGFRRRWSRAGKRGMSGSHDLVDWVGGYPFEVAKPGEVVEFCRSLGLVLEEARTTSGLGNNQFVFARPS
jgi:2-polyprenyl-6-hydroxyphenyl methylase/3-demethylubiquinone-9 3-methyltransferase